MAAVMNGVAQGAEARKGDVVLHEHVSYWTGANLHNHQHRTFYVSIVAKSDRAGKVQKVLDLATGAVREIGRCDRVWTTGLNPQVVREYFALLPDSEFESIDEARTILRTLVQS